MTNKTIVINDLIDEICGNEDGNIAIRNDAVEVIKWMTEKGRVIARNPLTRLPAIEPLHNLFGVQPEWYLSMQDADKVRVFLDGLPKLWRDINKAI